MSSRPATPSDSVHIIEEVINDALSETSRRSSSESSKGSISPPSSNSEDELKNSEGEVEQGRGQSSEEERDEQDQDRGGEEEEDEERELPFDYLNRIGGEEDKPQTGEWIQRFISLVLEEVNFGRSQLPNCASETELGKFNTSLGSNKLRL